MRYLSIISCTNQTWSKQSESFIFIIIISSILSSSNSEQLQSKTSCRDPKEEGKPTLTASEFWLRAIQVWKMVWIKGRRCPSAIGVLNRCTRIWICRRSNLGHPLPTFHPTARSSIPACIQSQPPNPHHPYHSTPATSGSSSLPSSLPSLSYSTSSPSPKASTAPLNSPILTLALSSLVSSSTPPPPPPESASSTPSMTLPFPSLLPISTPILSSSAPVSPMILGLLGPLFWGWLSLHSGGCRDPRGAAPRCSWSWRVWARSWQRPPWSRAAESWGRPGFCSGTSGRASWKVFADFSVFMLFVWARYTECLWNYQKKKKIAYEIIAMVELGWIRIGFLHCFAVRWSDLIKDDYDAHFGFNMCCCCIDNLKLFHCLVCFFELWGEGKGNHLVQMVAKFPEKEKKRKIWTASILCNSFARLWKCEYQPN